MEILSTSSNEYSHFVNVDTKDGQKILVNPNDIYIGRSLINQGEWEPYDKKIFNEYVKSGMKVLDLGANIGAHTIYLSKLVGDSGKVYAFEPCKINHDVLLFNCIQNRLSNVEVFKNGVSDEETTMYIPQKFNSMKNDGNYGFIVLHDKADEKAEKINVIKIDSLNLNVDFAKIDVEYMEEKVLFGMKETIIRCNPILLIEIHQEQIDRIFAIMKSFNYTGKYAGGYDYIFTPIV